MGYTHYWTPRPISPDAWQVVQRDFTSLFAGAKRLRIKLADGFGDGTKPGISETTIAFNGRGAESHETFAIECDGGDWTFCKTAQKPYDVIVTAALVYLASQHGYSVSSDGDESDWQAGLDLARKVWPHLELRIPAFAD